MPSNVEARQRIVPSQSTAIVTERPAPTNQRAASLTRSEWPLSDVKIAKSRWWGQLQWHELLLGFLRLLERGGLCSPFAEPLAQGFDCFACGD